MMKSFASPAVEGSPPTTVVGLLRRRAAEQPTQRVCTFVADGETHEIHLTYGELDRRARALAAALAQRGMEGARALLLLPNGLDYVAAFFGCVYAGVVAVPARLPGRSTPGPRARAIAADARPRVVVSTSSVRAALAGILPTGPGHGAPLWLDVDRVSDETSHAWRDPGVAPTALAVLQYATGTTAEVRGVMRTHANLLDTTALLDRVVGHVRQTHRVSWLPLHGGGGLVGGIIQTICGGGTVTLLSPACFLQRPVCWLQAISRTRAALSGGPPCAYELCARRTPARQRAGLDLSCWRVAATGPVGKGTIDHFLETFGPSGFRKDAFRPCYGLPEALIVCGGNGAEPPVYLDVQAGALRHHRVVLTTPDDHDGRVLVGCGRPLPDHKVLAVDPATCRPCAAGRVGEIWVRGPGVAQGYWDRPGESERVFRARLADNGDGPYLRTGDLGFLRDGELFITGRFKGPVGGGSGDHGAHSPGWKGLAGHSRPTPAALAVDG
jgi:acyl-CoA synthetase (AMP-forming)/AMP-acid ligase II